MKKLEFIIRPDKLDKLKQVLTQCGAGGVTLSSAMGCGNQKGRTDSSSYKGIELADMNLIPKLKAEVVVDDSQVEPMLALIHEHLSTGNVGDGKVFVLPVEEAMRIRTGQRGKKAI